MKHLNYDISHRGLMLSEAKKKRVPETDTLFIFSS
jgi:hypothetical protein